MHYLADLLTGVDPKTQGLDAIPRLLENLLNIAFYAVGVVSVIFVVVGGIQMVTSAGNPANIAKARRTITMAIAGLVLALSALLIVNFVYGGSSFLK